MKIKLIPHVNKNNKQISFSIKKSSLPDSVKNKLSNLKEIKIDTLDFKFENEFKGRWDNE